MSEARRILGSSILGLLNAPNALTLSGLMLALLSAMFAVKGAFYGALLCMIGSGVADLFDGFVARRTRRTALAADAGKQLDSLCDVCSFGFGPAIFAYCYGLREPWHVTLLLAYVSANALRLAYFNAAGMDAEGDRQYFTGMPVTYAALFVPIAFLGAFWLPQSAMVGLLAALYALLGAAMISGARIPKPKGAWYAIFGLLAVVMSGVFGWALVTGR